MRSVWYYAAILVRKGYCWSARLPRDEIEFTIVDGFRERERQKTYITELVCLLRLLRLEARRLRPVKRKCRLARVSLKCGRLVWIGSKCGSGSSILIRLKEIDGLRRRSKWTRTATCWSPAVRTQVKCHWLLLWLCEVQNFVRCCCATRLRICCRERSP